MITKERWQMYNDGLIGGREFAEEIMIDEGIFGKSINHPIIKEYHDLNEQVDKLFAPLIAKLARYPNI